MTNAKPVTDEQVADILGDLHQYHDYKMAECPFCAPIRARIDADREEIAANAHLIAEGIKVVNEQAAAIAALKGENAQLIEVYDHAQTGLKSMRAEAGKMREEIAHLKARYARDMCADGHERIRYTPEEEFGPCPVCVLRAENSTQGRLLALKEGELAALKAEVERLKASVRLACSEDYERAARLIRMAESGNTVKPADDSGTGRAR